jgi:transcriptional regulator of acetoin/glycerol metabolism
VLVTDGDGRLVSRAASNPSLSAELDARGALPGSRFSEDAVGTNALGTAIERQRPVLVAGSEHFRYDTVGITSAAAPVRDRGTSRPAGWVCVVSRYEHTSPALLPLVTELVRAVEARLVESWSTDQRGLLDAFLRAGHRGPRAVVAASDDLFVANAAAQALVGPADRELVRREATDAVADGRDRTVELTLSDGLTVVARCVPYPMSRRPPAVVVTLTPVRACHGAAPPSGAEPSAWARLLAAGDRARAAGLSVLVTGERGTGKTTLVRAVHARAPGTLTELDARDSGLRPAEWLGQLSAALRVPGGAVLVRHLDEIARPLVDATRTAVTGAPAYLYATTGLRRRGDLVDVTEQLPVVLDLPPLRDRLHELAGLVAKIAVQVHPTAPRPRFGSDAMAALAAADWPGNVRELRQVVSTALMTCAGCVVGLDDLPTELRDAGYGHRLSRMERIERQALVAALREAGWNRDRAAGSLGISRATLYRRLRAYDIRQPGGGGRPR